MTRERDETLPSPPSADTLVAEHPAARRLEDTQWGDPLENDALAPPPPWPWPIRIVSWILLLGLVGAMCGGFLSVFF